MKLSENTVDLLRNFASINANLVVQPGSEITTISDTKSIIAKAKIEETFDERMAIYDLREFLSTVNLFQDPDLNITTKTVEISEGRQKADYKMAEPEVLTYLDRSLNLPPADVSFTLPVEDYKAIMRAASTLGRPNLVIETSANGLTLKATDVENSSAHSYTHVVNEDHYDDHEFVFNIANFKLIDDTYKVGISAKGIAQFESDRVSYWITMSKKAN